jgi:hypothetical protein
MSDRTTTMYWPCAASAAATAPPPPAAATGTTRSLLGPVAALAVALTAGGCDRANPERGEPSVPALGSAVSATQPATDPAVDAYQSMWTAYTRAGLTANPDHPDLARYATGLALTTLRNGLAGYRKQRQVLKGDLVTAPHPANASPANEPTTVSIVDCLDTTNFLVYRADGRLADDEPGGRRAVRATVIRSADGWKVSSFGVQQVGTC